MKLYTSIVVFALVASAQTGTNWPFKGNGNPVPSNSRAARDQIQHVKAVVVEIYHDISLISGSQRRDARTEARIAANFQEFERLQTVTPYAAQFSACVAKDRAAYPHVLRSADLFSEYSRLRLSASKAQLDAILREENQESKLGGDLLKESLQCSKDKV